MSQCFGCKKNFESGEEFISYGDNNFHELCFTLGDCPGCNQPVRGGAVAKLPDANWHGECYQKFKASKPPPKTESCAKCGRPITTRILSVFGQKWHPECFTCTSCESPLSGSCVNVEGKAYCQPCVDKMQSRMQEPSAPQSTPAQSTPAQSTPVQSTPSQPAQKPWQQKQQQTSPSPSSAQPKPWQQKQQEQQQPSQSQPLKPWQQRQQEQKQQQQQQQQQQKQQQAPKEDSEICGGCGNPITEGRMLRAMSKPWHEDCFRCSRCKTKFEGSFVEYEGAACCQSCVSQAQEEERKVRETEQQLRNLSTNEPPKPAPVGRGGGVARGAGAVGGTPGRGSSPSTGAGRAASPFGGSGRGAGSAGGPGGFSRSQTTPGTVQSPSPGQKLSYKEQREMEKKQVQCTHCQCQIQDAIMRFQGVPYCSSCAGKIQRGEISLSVVPGTTPNCSHCKKPINVISYKTVDKKSYHTECLTCNVCGISVVDFFQEKGGQILCDAHYQEIMEIENPKRVCCKCSEKIVGQYLEGGGRFYHPGCYVCEGCFTPLADKKAFAIQNQPYCQSCYMKRGAEDPSIMGGLRGSRK